MKHEILNFLKANKHQLFLNYIFTMQTLFFAKTDNPRLHFTLINKVICSVPNVLVQLPLQHVQR